MKYNDDESVDLYFGPELPKGVPESNWRRTVPGKGWFVLFRLYSPEKPFFNGSWRPGDFEKITNERREVSIKMLKKTMLIAMVIGAVFTSSVLQAETLDTRIGKLEFTHDFANGYPTDATVKKLFNEMDFQRAVQAYIWAIPAVSMSQWQHEHVATLGAENGQIVFIESYDDRAGGLTYNSTTPYVLPFIDLADGPWVAVMPEGEVRGAAHDMWQIAMTTLTEPGKYMFVGPVRKCLKVAS